VEKRGETRKMLIKRRVNDEKKGEKKLPVQLYLQ